MTNEQKLQIALAIYRGLDDAEREQRRTELREAAAVNPYAKTLLDLFASAEREILREREAANKLREQVANLSNIVREQANGEQRVYASASADALPKLAAFAGGVFAVGYVGMAVVEAVVTSGLLVWIAGGFAGFLCLSGIDWKAMRTPVEVEQKATGRVTNIYVTQDGPINITQN